MMHTMTLLVKVEIYIKNSATERIIILLLMGISSVTIETYGLR